MRLVRIENSPRRRRVAVALVMTMLIAAFVSGCGSGNRQLRINLTAQSNNAINPGDLPSYTLQVINDGPGDATGVVARVDLPGNFRYAATSSLNGNGEVRTQPVDPQTGTPTPSWGQWTLPAPTSVVGSSSPQKSELDITFTMQGSGSAGQYQFTPHVISDQSDQEVDGKAIPVVLAAAPSLGITVTATPVTLPRDNDVSYHIIITNNGSAPANDVGVLITLPSGMVYTTTVSTKGNAPPRSSPIDPVPQANLPFYGGWTIPAQGNIGAGILSIVLTAHVLPDAPGGPSPVSVQVTDASGLVISAANAAPVTILAPSPSASPSPALRLPSPSSKSH